MLAFCSSPVPAVHCTHGGLRNSSPSTSTTAQHVGTPQPHMLVASFGVCAALGSGIVARSRRRTRQSGGSGRRSLVSANAVATASETELTKIVTKKSPHPDEEILPGDLVSIHYKGWLEDGTLFDSSYARGKPFEFTIGEGDVIDGWEMLILTMSLGEVAELQVPPEYGYGAEGIPPIVPANNTLKFEVEVMEIGRPVEFSEGGEGEEEAPAAQEPEAAQEDDEDEEDQLFWEKDPDKEAGRGPGWEWEASGSGDEIRVTVPMSDNVKLKQLKVDVRTFSIKCEVEGNVVLDGPLSNEILMDDSHWDIERKGDQVVLVISLAKLDAEKKWESLLQGGDPNPNPEQVQQAEVEVVGAESKAAPTGAAEVVDVDAA